MFSPTEDLSRSPRQWKTALRNAAELVVAFATLDSYPQSRAPHGSSDAPHAPFDFDAEVVIPGGDPHGRADRVLPSARRRGHGRPPVRPAVCLHGGRTGSVPAPTPAPTSPRTLSR